MYEIASTAIHEHATHGYEINDVIATRMACSNMAPLQLNAVKAMHAGHENMPTFTAGDDIYCNATCDGYLCWPPTPAGETLYQNCPKGLLSNQKMCAFRRCGSEGLWLGRHLNDTSPKGWTNYTPCFPTLVQKILDKVNEDEAEAQLKFETAVNTRTIEMVGIALSFLTICAAIFIFNAFPSLHNRRTVIHRHLFYALLMEVTVRMVLYTQQSYSFDGVDPLEENARKGIEYFPYVCEGAYVLLEYSRLVVYGWMFIEGIFLNTLISANTLRNEIPINYFYTGGWGVPGIVIAIWATVVGRHYSKEPLNTCWYGYNYLPSYYIIQGPILAIVSINMLFLGTIMSVVIMKLRRTNDSELRKIQKTIRATLILLPLLGIINIFNLFDYPLDGSSTGFAIWAYFTHFFRSFQGVFISFIYCFSNGEVRKAIKKKCERRTWCRFGWIARRRRALPSGRPRDRPVFAIADDNMELVPVPIRPWTRPSSTHMVSDIEAGPSHAEALPDTENISTMPRGKKSRPAPIPWVFPAADTVHPSKLHAVRVVDDQPLTDALARLVVTGQAHSSSALLDSENITTMPRRKKSQPAAETVLGSQSHAFRGLGDPPVTDALARMRATVKAHISSSADPARSEASQQRFQNQDFVGDVSCKRRASMDMPLSKQQAEDLKLSPRRRSNEGAVSQEHHHGFRFPPRRASMEMLSQQEYQDLVLTPRRASMEMLSQQKYQELMSSPRRRPNERSVSKEQHHGIRCPPTPHTIPRSARRPFVRPGLVTRDSRDHRRESSCF